jgi:hypothetical protein
VHVRRAVAVYVLQCALWNQFTFAIMCMHASVRALVAISTQLSARCRRPQCWPRTPVRMLQSNRGATGLELRPRLGQHLQRYAQALTVVLGCPRHAALQQQDMLQNDRHPYQPKSLAPAATLHIKDRLTESRASIAPERISRTRSVVAADFPTAQPKWCAHSGARSRMHVHWVHS